MFQASAPGKVILFGEHAVVYGRPAIAAPVFQVRATATVQMPPAVQQFTLALPDINERLALAQAPADHALAHAARLTLAQLNLTPPPPWWVELRSTIPIASGMGSGAAAATALVRAIAAAAGRTLPAEQVSALVFQSETLFHGTPSGIDNTVIAFEQPVWFVKGRPPLPFAIGRPITLVIADSGIASPTRGAVGDVRRGWQAAPARYESLFDRAGRIAGAAHQAIERGDVAALGPLMDENQQILQALDVSSPALDRLQAAAKAAGALGAKLSGGGRGGNLIALVQPDQAGAVAAALDVAGAARTLITTIR